MATEVKMPKLGIDMVDGLISRWLKEEGDTVEANEAIAEVRSGTVNRNVIIFD